MQAKQLMSVLMATAMVGASTPTVAFASPQTVYSSKGLSLNQDSSGKWVAMKNGQKVNYTGLVKNPQNGAWYYVQNGNYKSATGIAKNDNGTYYVQKGKVNFNFQGLRSNSQNINKSKGIWYFKKAKLQSNYTGFVYATYRGVKADWYVKNGKVAPGYVSAAKTTNGSTPLKVNKSTPKHYTGFAECKWYSNPSRPKYWERSTWLVKNGYLSKSYFGSYPGVLNKMYGTFPVRRGEIPTDTTFTVDSDFTGKVPAVVKCRIRKSDGSSSTADVYGIYQVRHGQVSGGPILK